MKRRRSQETAQTTPHAAGTEASPRRGGRGNAARAQRLELSSVRAAASDSLPHRAALERAFGEDLSDVRVGLGDEQATGLLDTEGAEAAAVGDAILFSTPNPSLELVAHEVAHVLQQRQAGSGGGQAEVEADDAARAVASGRSFSVEGGAPIRPAFKKHKVSKVRKYGVRNQGRTKANKAEKRRQKERAAGSPGRLLGAYTGGDERKRIRALSDGWDNEHPRGAQSEGLHRAADGTWEAPEVEHPQGSDWDPLQYQPKFVFPKEEDALPVRPDFDGSGRAKQDDADSYKRGRIGDDQALTGAFSVARKGRYVVLTYSLYMVDNRFYGNYHKGDSATAAVYLAKNSKGEWKPAFLYTSWHYGARMTRWSAFKKDGGRPIIQMERGSHALHVFGKGEKVDERGLVIGGDGKAYKNGERVGRERMTWLSAQSNTKNTTDMSGDQLAMDTYFKKYPERTNPVHPGLFGYKGPKRRS